MRQLFITRLKNAESHLNEVQSSKAENFPNAVNTVNRSKHNQTPGNASSCPQRISAVLSTDGTPVTTGAVATAMDHVCLPRYMYHVCVAQSSALALDGMGRKVLALIESIMIVPTPRITPEMIRLVTEFRLLYGSLIPTPISAAQEGQVSLDNAGISDALLLIPENLRLKWRSSSALCGCGKTCQCTLVECLSEMAAVYNHYQEYVRLLEMEICYYRMGRDSGNFNSFPGREEFKQYLEKELQRTLH